MLTKCRACLGSNNEMKLLSEEEPDGKQLITMFKSVNNFEWINDNKIAPYLCKECELALKISYNFRKKCLESNEIILKELESLQKQEIDVIYRVNQQEKYICDVCLREFKSDNSLKSHFKIHRGDTRYKCQFCSKLHKNRAQLVDHERTHTGEKPHICCVCGKGFAQSGALNTHMKIHTGRPISCDICDKRFCRPSELQVHLRRHSGEKPFLCNECGKAFIQKSHLVEHTKTHSDERPFLCTICEKSFKHKSLLNSHLQLHSGYRPFQCKLCEYACFKSYRLKQHMKLHESQPNLKKVGERICPICDKSFSSQVMLNGHLASAHNAVLEKRRQKLEK